MKPGRWGTLIFVVAAGGCGAFGPTLRVCVTTQDGVPIVGAEVYAVTPSFNGEPRMTDQHGETTLPLNQIQDVQWVGVVAKGFEAKQVPVPSDSLLRIILSPHGRDVQSKSAEEVLRTIQESINNARTLTIRFRLQGLTLNAGGRIGEFLQSGMQAWYSEDTKAPIETWCVSDGRRVQCTLRHANDEGIVRRVADYQQGVVPANLMTNLKLLVVQWGLRPMLVRSAFNPYLEHDFSKELEVSNLRHGERGEAANTLVYNLKIQGMKDPVEIRLWYDPTTFYLIKRRTSDPGESGPSGISTEVYEEVRLNAEVPEERFKIR